MNATPGPHELETGTTSAPVILPITWPRGPAARNSAEDRNTGDGRLPFGAGDRRPLSQGRTKPLGRFVFPAVPPDDESECDSLEAIWPECNGPEEVEAAGALAERLCQRLPRNRPAVLAITSPGDGDGKTRVISALAPELARRISGNVLAVDADFRKAGLTGLLRLAAGRTPGGPLMIYPTDIPGLSVLPHPPGFESRYFDGAWIRATREDWGLTLLDMASLEHAEAVSLLPHCDGVCLVIRLGHTPRRAVAESRQVIAACGAKLLGTAVVA
jgi:hypothetical protein